MPITEREARFASHGVYCAATVFGPAERLPPGPCIVMAHGLGGIRKLVLPRYARSFAEAGYRVLNFDYRYWGDSDGVPRQLISIEEQLEDWANAIAYARSLPGVDPARIALFGTSLSGGHVIVAAARDGKIAAITAQCPLMDGRATALHSLRHTSPARSARFFLLAVLDKLAGAFGLPPVRAPLVAAAGEFGLMTSADAKLGIEQLFAASDMTPYPVHTGARVSMEIARYRPIRYASRIRCPTLVIACTHDDLAPSWSAEQVVKRIGSAARLVWTELGHFEIYVNEGFEFTRAEHLDFFRRVLPVEFGSMRSARAGA